jgi:hypothetical protein
MEHGTTFTVRGSCGFLINKLKVDNIAEVEAFAAF